MTHGLTWATVPIAKPQGRRLAAAENGGKALRRQHYRHLRRIGWTPRMARRYREVLRETEVDLPERVRKAVN